MRNSEASADPHETKQVIRLVLAEEFYLDLAQVLGAKRRGLFLKASKDAFESDTRVHSSDPIHLVSHLASAAVRLWAIEEFLMSRVYGEVVDYFNGNGPEKDIREDAILRRWLHGMMRDNLAHVETNDLDMKVAACRRKTERRLVVESLPFERIFAILSDIAADVRRRVTALGIPLPARESDKSCGAAEIS
jgi:hypothetical protein